MVYFTYRSVMMSILVFQFIPSSASGNQDLFSPSMTLFFLINSFVPFFFKIPCISNIISLCFSVWLSELTMTVCRSIHVAFPNWEFSYKAKHPLTKWVSSIQFSRSVVSTLCDPMNHNTPVLPVHHQLLESIKTHVHRVGDAIQPSYPLSSPSPPAPNPSQR